MRRRAFTAGASALLLLTASVVSATHGVHDHLEALHKRHRANRHLNARSTAENGEHGVEMRSISESTSQTQVEKRSGQCAFPTNAGLVSVTPNESNAGWAMSPDQSCTPGTYCPYACPPGEVSMQWNPSATSYTYPLSMDGGLYCDENGNIQKPFPNNPYCKSTETSIGVQNNAGDHVSFCQTVLPGNEAMLIPTLVTDSATLAAPDMSYWCETAAHYYINPPGIDTETACVWGTNANPYGNWSPYVAGANVDASGNTYIKLGWNPIYLEEATPFRNEMPTWGVEIDCPNGGCNGLPCAIDPSKNSVNEMEGGSTVGAGGATFCVVTVEKGSSAQFIVSSAGGSSSGSSSSSSGSVSSSNTSPSSGAGSSTAAWTNGGQFYESSASWSASASTYAWSASSSTTTTHAHTTSVAWPTSSSTTSSTKSSSTAEWSPVAWSSTSTHSSKQTQSTHTPYYSYSNSTTTATSSSFEGLSQTSVVVDATATPSGPTSSVSPSIKPATGAASSAQYSLASLLFGLALYGLATL
ncbi:SUN domain-containing protein [Exophiala viscosa]|uniref:SUN domain-containing protein n=1 Tax=Exophiala viscosa TaxID=2486360 RepID=A0AAN6IIW9_9EURO|nr:SUN domain-containing protein [Exophiala viscosa]